MAYNRQLTKKVAVQVITNDTYWENFESLTLIDSGATDGFQVAGEDDVYGQIPTGIVVNVGKDDTRPCTKFSVKATSGKSLAVTAILYQ